MIFCKFDTSFRTKAMATESEIRRWVAVFETEEELNKYYIKLTNKYKSVEKTILTPEEVLNLSPLDIKNNSIGTIFKIYEIMKLRGVLDDGL